MADAPVFVVDSELCAGHGRCYALAPESFAPDDSGYAQTLGRDESDRDEAMIAQIIGTCPEEAIRLESASMPTQA